MECASAAAAHAGSRAWQRGAIYAIAAARCCFRVGAGAGWEPIARERTPGRRPTREPAGRDGRRSHVAQGGSRRVRIIRVMVVAMVGETGNAWNNEEGWGVLVAPEAPGRESDLRCSGCDYAAASARAARSRSFTSRAGALAAASRLDAITIERSASARGAPASAGISAVAAARVSATRRARRSSLR